MIVGADVSSWQHSGGAAIDWPTYAASQGLVIVKATQGSGYVNPYFAADVRGAHDAGVPLIGAYHWPMPGPVAPQVDSLLRALDPVRDLLTFRVWFDFEEPTLPGHGSLDEHRQRVQDAGYETGTYTYPYYWQAHGSPACQECAADPLWWASYGEPMRPAPAPWSAVTLWQYAGTSVPVPGLAGLNDHNRLLTAPTVPEDEEMAYIVKDPRSNQQWLVAQDGSCRTGIYSMADLGQFESDPRNRRLVLSAAQLDAIPAVKR